MKDGTSLKLTGRALVILPTLACACIAIIAFTSSPTVRIIVTGALVATSIALGVIITLVAERLSTLQRVLHADPGAARRRR